MAKDLRYAWFPGCKIAYYQPHYEAACRAVLGRLGVELVDIEFACCGFPVRHESPEAHLFTAARNLALAARKGLEIITPCQCCYGSLQRAAYTLGHHPERQTAVNRALADEGLKHDTASRPRHLLQVLGREPVIKAIQGAITHTLDGVPLAVHNGCNSLRPSWVMQFDNPFNPELFNRLVDITGAKRIDWALQYECCGNPQLGKNDELALEQTRRKLRSARRFGAEYICVACTYCQIQFDTVQHQSICGPDWPNPLPSILYPQLLGLALGLGPDELGLKQNLTGGAGLAASVKPVDGDKAA